MTDRVTNELIHDTLKRMQETLVVHTRYHQETRDSLGTLEQQYASISRRVDRIYERLECIERRLDLSDASVGQ